ncbi:MAG: GNAT family N-acetyltransferase [Anaerolineaceae bacterium]|nr:GNAT family N-acetyltransferase [Anaerolineaceae bacterium]
MIRNIETRDIQRVCDIYNLYVLTTNASFEIDPVPVEEMESRVAEFTRVFPYLVYEEGEEVIGFCYASKFRPRLAYRFTAEVTIYLDKEHLGKGIGKQLYKELFARLQILGFHSLIAAIALPNEKSQALHESFGFKQVAHFKDMGYKLDQWIDVGYWQKML